MSEAVCVVGAGAWGTALAVHLGRAGQAVRLWARDPAPLRAARASPHLPGVTLPETVEVVDAPQEGTVVLLAVPMQHLRAVTSGLPPGGALVACCKGVERATGSLPLEVLAQVQPGRPAAILTGPTFAHEVAAGLPTAAVVAAEGAGLRERVAALLGGPAFRLYGNADPLGAQIGGAAKNVIAIAAGCVSGAGLGENARAALVTRGVAELSRLVASLGGRAETAAGLSGLGDLLLTCTGRASRNLRLGEALAQGLPLAQALASLGGVAEGAATASALLTRATQGERRVDLPICTAVAALLDGRLGVAEAVAALLARPRRDE
ncbi:MAG: NAD(P)H-dependent glycerol-3-phosphate dehydrogenase [Acetobacteraceae bacterium]|nr:NAD(P)H-dependent glycerol-3-phosphate dehydrogenase [Acetobacteraceae bacterium]